jgi:hypothetical protein
LILNKQATLPITTEAANSIQDAFVLDLLGYFGLPPAPKI